MNACYNKAVKIEGWTVRDNNYYFSARNDISGNRIDFIAEGRNGGLYFHVEGFYNRLTDRYYKAQRYTIKFIPQVRELAFYLAHNDYLWDYGTQTPFLESRENEKRRINAKRIAAGRVPLYDVI